MFIDCLFVSHTTICVQADGVSEGSFELMWILYL
jgi:hypothetical protein